MNAEEEFAKMWMFLCPDPDSPIHLRGLSPKGRETPLAAKNLIFTPAEYPLITDRCSAMMASAIALNDIGYNIYTCVNPIKPGHVAATVNDNDIACRRLVLIDIDRVATLEAPATDEEITQALELADQISASLSATMDATIFRVMSGNGVHLYLSLEDLPNDENSKQICKRLLNGLAARFDNGVMKIDTTVYNASRITKVPGTIMRKGVATNDRPYRMACVL